MVFIVVLDSEFYSDGELPYCQAHLPKKCANCNTYMMESQQKIKALGVEYHAQCLRCAKCSTPLSNEVYDHRGQVRDDSNSVLQILLDDTTRNDSCNSRIASRVRSVVRSSPPTRGLRQVRAVPCETPSNHSHL
jgi:hypothetical protein